MWQRMDRGITELKYILVLYGGCVYTYNIDLEVKEFKII